MRDRRSVLAGLAGVAAGAAAAALPGLARAGSPAPALPTTAGPEPAPSCGITPELFPGIVVETHEGRRARFYEDLVRGKTVMIHFTSVASEAAYPVLANLARVQACLRDSCGDRLGRDVFLYSITLDPEHDTLRALRQLAAHHGAGPGWLFLTGEPAAIGLLRARLFAHDGVGHVHSAGPVEDCSRGLVRYGNAAVGLWGSVPAKADPQQIAARLAWVQARPAPATEVAAGPPRRRGPVPLSEQPWGRRGEERS
jgi:protein SCO1